MRILIWCITIFKRGKTLKLQVLTIISLISLQAIAFQSTQVLPESRHILLLSYGTLSKPIENHYDNQGNLSNYSKESEFEINSQAIAKSDAQGTKLITILNQISPNSQVGKDLDLGRIELQGSNDVKATVIGLGRGINSSWTLGFGLPIFDAQTNYRLVYIPSGQINNLKSEYYGIHPSLDQAFDQMENFGEKNINEVLAKYNYEPVQDWRYKGIGDIHLVSKYNFLSQTLIHLSLLNDLIIPTGYKDNPRLLQDVNLSEETLSLDNILQSDVHLKRFSLYVDVGIKSGLAQEKEVRYFDQDPSLATGIEKTKTWKGITLGSQQQISYELLEFLSPYAAHIYRLRTLTKYQSSNLKVKDMESKENFSMESYRLGFNFDFAKLFLKKKFIAPLFMDASYEKTIRGTNTIDLSYYRIDLGSYF